MSLQRLKVIPDKFIKLETRAEQSMAKIKQRVYERNPQLYGDDLDDITVQCFNEQDIAYKAVDDSFKQFIFKFETTDMANVDIVKHLSKMLKLRYKSDAPRRPPRVILLGPPGSSRSTQSQVLADTFGLVNISPMQLLS